ncbi:ribonuclease H-like domain-containing protein [Tanacetum coccineum]
MHYRLSHPGQGILGLALAIYAPQPTTLPSAFSIMSPQDPTWHMDTGASSHLNFNVSNLSTIFDKRLFSSVHVGDGKSIPVTNTGHNIIPSHHRPLHLHNVFVTPNIIKNIISVCQFTRDNNCTIEFDAFGFSVNDYLTRHILLRCDSSGDLYPVTPSTSPIAFLSTSASTWHQRLGHPGDQVLRSLVSSRFISCNKEKSSHICHACQLGKHVKLPFHSSDSIVEHCFDIIHSDLWTSPIISSSGFKYYVLFLDHFSHYLWIYPLRSKSDMFDKFLHFRNYVKNQFRCEIKSFQCDHGELLEYMDVHDNDASESSQPSWGKECTYQDFMKCQPLFFRGTEGVVDLTQWFERMETVFRISNCTVENQVKFATCTLMGIALTWWNSHVRTVTNDVAYAMTWTDLKKKMTTKYCPRNEIKKIEAEMWNLKVKGTDVVAYNQRFQELALLCDRMFPEETDKIERYVGGMPDLIYSSVVASKPKTMQEAIEMATELMDRRINTFAERQAENKRKFEDTPRNNQNC